jgi:gas vesicle structural protein
MSMTQSSISRAPRPSSLADVVDLILDKGLVIDAYVRVSLVGIELLTIDARIVIASVDTYLHFAEAVNRLDLRQTETAGLKELVGGRQSQNGRESGDQGGQREREVTGRRPPPQAVERGDRYEGRRSGLAERLAERGKWS